MADLDEDKVMGSQVFIRKAKFIDAGIYTCQGRSRDGGSLIQTSSVVEVISECYYCPLARVLGP